MPLDIRFPRAVATPGAPAESSQIIRLLTEVGDLELGGGVAGVYASIAAWKTVAESKSPYLNVAIEVTGSAAVLVGDGTAAQAIGLFGEITGVGQYLISVLGFDLGALVPQIPIASATVGFAQIVQFAPIYDRLSVGGIFAAVPVPGAPVVTVTARPVRQRFYVG